MLNYYIFLLILYAILFFFIVARIRKINIFLPFLFLFIREELNQHDLEHLLQCSSILLIQYNKINSIFFAISLLSNF